MTSRVAFQPQPISDSVEGLLNFLPVCHGLMFYRGTLKCRLSKIPADQIATGLEFFL